MIHKIVSEQAMPMKNLQTFDEYLASVIDMNIEFMRKYSSDTVFKRLDAYYNGLKNLTIDMKGIKESWDNEYYVLEADIEFDNDKKRYNILSLNVSLVKNTDEVDHSVNSSMIYRSKLKLSDENTETFRYTPYGIFNDKPLYIHDNVKILLENGFELKEIKHSEIRGESSSKYKHPLFTYKNTIFTIWFFKGLILKCLDTCYTVAKIGIVHEDLFGVNFIDSSKGKEISGEVEFTVKNKKIKL